MARNVAQSLACLAALSALLCGAFVACGDEGSSAPARTGTPGCTGDACFDASTPKSDGGGPAPADGGAPDAPIVYPDPLEGTTKAATLVASGFQFTEGPLWIGGKLLFSDIPANTIRELLADGGTSVYRANSNGANGNAVDPQGRIVSCEGTAKRVTRADAAQGSATAPIATTFTGAGFNSPNDVIVRSDGNLYFTDPNYSGGGNATQDAEAVYRIDTSGAVTRLAATFMRPNGIALSPDGATLYVVDNGTGKLQSAPVAAGGSVGAFVTIGDTPGGDGMGVDDAGNLYVTCSDGVRVFDKSGKALGTITVPQVPANCTFGGADRRTLYITARTALYAIKLNVPGLP